MIDLYILQERLNKFLNGINRKKIYNLQKGEIGINLGCDLDTTPYFVGLDGSFLIHFMKFPLLPRFIKKRFYERTFTSKKHSFNDYLKIINSVKIIHHDLSWGIPFKNNSVNYIFTSHFLEHLKKENATKLLRECFRVLRKNGRIRIIVPNMDDYISEMETKIKQYKKDRKTDPLQEYLTRDSHVNSEFGFHKRIYNFEELKALLISAGFKNIRKEKRYSGSFPNLRELEIRDGLIIEAEKNL